jgi:tRNA (Thr-GGU) A37 N-methylase
VELVKREKNILFIKGVDVLDGTPLLDIKPYTPAFDIFEVTSTGWMEGKHTEMQKKTADDRFKQI